MTVFFPADLARLVFETMGHFTIARDASFNATSHAKQHEFQELFFALEAVLKRQFIMTTGISEAAFDSNSVEFRDFKKLSENLIEVVNYNQKECPLEVYPFFFCNAHVEDGIVQIKVDVRAQIYAHEVHDDGRVGSLFALVKKFGNLLFPDFNKHGLPQCIPTRAKAFRLCQHIFANNPEVTGKQAIGTFSWKPFKSPGPGFVEDPEMTKVLAVLARSCPGLFTLVLP